MQYLCTNHINLLIDKTEDMKNMNNHQHLDDLQHQHVDNDNVTHNKYIWVDIKNILTPNPSVSERELFSLVFWERKDTSKMDLSLWNHFYHNDGLNAKNLIKKELDHNQKRFPGQYVYVFKLNDIYCKTVIELVNKEIKVFSIHKDDWL